MMSHQARLAKCNPLPSRVGNQISRVFACINTQGYDSVTFRITSCRSALASFHALKHAISMKCSAVFRRLISTWSGIMESAPWVEILNLTYQMYILQCYIHYAGFTVVLNILIHRNIRYQRHFLYSLLIIVYYCAITKYSWSTKKHSSVFQHLLLLLLIKIKTKISNILKFTIQYVLLGK